LLVIICSSFSSNFQLLVKVESTHFP